MEPGMMSSYVYLMHFDPICPLLLSLVPLLLQMVFLFPTKPTFYLSLFCF